MYNLYNVQVTINFLRRNLLTQLESFTKDWATVLKTVHPELIADVDFVEEIWAKTIDRKMRDEPIDNSRVYGDENLKLWASWRCELDSVQHAIDTNLGIQWVLILSAWSCKEY